MPDEFSVFGEDGRPAPTSQPPSVGSGVAWVRGSYRHNVYPSPFDVRVGSGLRAWMLIDELEFTRGDYDEVVRRHEGQIGLADVEAAVRHYFRYKDEIDAKIAEHRAPVT